MQDIIPQPPKYFRWQIIKIVDGVKESTIYNSLIRRPVDKDHVLSSPAVRRWLGEDELYGIGPAPKK
jgi:hypothetical protein